jgi:predicted MFS family arabinose efflux permease
VRILPEPGPLRLLSVSTLVNTFGNGLFYTSAALFYTRSVGLSPSQVGLGLTFAGLLSLLVGIPVGHLADLRGAREVLMALLVAQGLVMTSLALVHSFGAFVLVVVAFACLDKAANAVRQGLVARALPADQRVSGRAYLRSLTNLGIGAGSVFAGFAIAADTRSAYLALVFGDAVTYVLAAGATYRLPATAHADRRTGGSMLVAVRDKPFLAVTAVNALLSTHFAVLEIGVPLWVDRRTSAPTWTVAVLFLINTACCVLFQVRASRGAVDVPTSARVLRNGAFLLAGSYLVFALSGGRSTTVAVAVLVVAALVNVLGELKQSAGSWGLGFGLARESAQSQYQGLYSTGFAVSSMLGPVLVTQTAIAHGAPGWVFLAVFFAAAGAVAVPVSAWAERERAEELAQAGTAEA